MSKIHYFTVAVHTSKDRASAASAVLAAFASRQPDGCSFNLFSNRVSPEAWTQIRDLRRQNSQQARTIARLIRLANQMTGVSR